MQIVPNVQLDWELIHGTP
jgi:hypothetical protein